MNTIRNFVFSFGSFILSTLLSFITRTVFIYLLSAEYLGVNGLFSNILAILSLAEVGAGGAFVSLLYRPLANNDTEQLASIMAAFQKVYVIIGCIVGVVGVCLIPFLDFFTAGSSIPHLTIIYLLFVSNSVVTYFCADKIALINADQKSYLVTFYSQFFVLIQYTLQIVVLLLTHNFILYLCVQIFCAIGLNLYLARKARKLYPYLCKQAKPLTSDLRQNLKQKLTGGFCVHIGGVISVGTDSLIISHFLGLAILGIYSNYLLIIGIVMKLSDMVISAVHASASNLVVSSSQEDCYLFFRKLNFITMTMLGFFCTCLITLFNPFITVWIGKSYLMELPLVILIVLIYMSGFHGLQMPIFIYRNAKGLYYNDRYVSMMEGIVNLTISLLLVKQIGIAGVFIGTILSTILTTFSGTYLIYRYIFNRPMWEYWMNLCKYFFQFAVIGSMVFYTSHLIPCTSWLLFFAMAVSCGFMTLLLYLLVFWHTEEFKYFKEQIIHVLFHKLKK